MVSSSPNSEVSQLQHSDSIASNVSSPKTCSSGAGRVQTVLPEKMHWLMDAQQQ